MEATRSCVTWFAADALNAETTDLIEGDPPASSVALTWTDGRGLTHMATYRLCGNSLIRDSDGAQTVVARRVLSACFSLSREVLTFNLELDVDAARNAGQETVSFRTYARISGLLEAQTSGAVLATA